MTTAVRSVRAELMARLARVVGETLRVPAALVEPDVPFTALGMDSLAAVELTAAIEDEVGFELPVGTIYEHDDLDSLTRFIESRTALDVASDLHARLRRDAILPGDIRPCGNAHTGLVPRTADARTVLVTGATGFVGAYLLRALLDETTSTVLCLVRRRHDDSVERLHGNLRHYGLWKAGDASRIRVVHGDLTAFMLGMRAETFTRVAESVDAIYHGGAAVNWVHGYDTLRDANVVGTREILRFACTGVPKPVHFLSSLGVCYSTGGPPVVAEDDDMMPAIHGLHLGYAQSKCVAESLVRAAGARGLPVTITRPALVSGDSVSGVSNVDDLLARFIAGCIHLRAAPDLDWTVDCVPVDHVARAVVRLSRAHTEGCAMTHLSSRHGRHWRECVLWMRLCGYEVELLPYREWLDVLRATSDTRNPLHPLRPFFLRQVDDADGLTLPELYEEVRRSRVETQQSDHRLSALDAPCPPLSAKLLDRYVAHYVARGIVPPTARHASPNRGDVVAPDSEPSLDDLVPALTASLRSHHADPSLVVRHMALAPFETDDSIVSELTSWRHRTCAGLFRATVELDGCDSTPRSVELVIKVKPSDDQVLDVAESVARMASPELGRVYRMHRDHTGFIGSHVRELALYSHPDERLRRNMPVAHAVLRDDDAARWMIAMERVEPALSRGLGSESAWAPEQIGIALRGLAEIHSVWLGRDHELCDEPWLAPRRDATHVVAMTPLWIELARHARRHSAPWQNAELALIHERLAGDVESWAALAHGPRTLIHNDFNPRNITIREDRSHSQASGPSTARLCAYDWELATIGLPQRDLAEFLAFALSSHAEPPEVLNWIECYRRLLEEASGQRVSAAEWMGGFQSALCELLVDRLAMYAMIDRFRPQRFLPRVAGTWLALYRAVS